VATVVLPAEGRPVNQTVTPSGRVEVAAATVRVPLERSRAMGGPAVESRGALRRAR
jgi:hypothetical protein